MTRSSQKTRDIARKHRVHEKKLEERRKGVRQAGPAITPATRASGTGSLPTAPRPATPRPATARPAAARPAASTGAGGTTGGAARTTRPTRPVTRAPAKPAGQS
jgi:hypothetical protein